MNSLEVGFGDQRAGWSFGSFGGRKGAVLEQINGI